MPKDELGALAEDLGIDPTRYKTRQLLVAALHERRQLIASLDREAMLDVVRWGRRPVALNASKDQIAQEIARIKSMKFSGLSAPRPADARAACAAWPSPRPTRCRSS